MILVAFALLGSMPIDVKAGESPLTTLEQRQTGALVTLSFQDTDELIQGTQTPVVPRVGEPMTLSLTVAALSGAAFAGPVTISLRPLEALGGTDAVTVQPTIQGPAGTPAERRWEATLTPKQPGPHRLELAWTSTHRKVARGLVTVEEGRVAAWVPTVVGSALILMALALGAWLVLRRQGVS